MTAMKSRVAFIGGVAGNLVLQIAFLSSVLPLRGEAERRLA
jgi:hypothetical protein